jgi:hypothetical protein
VYLGLAGGNREITMGYTGEAPSFCEVNPACAKSFEEIERRLMKAEDDSWRQKIDNKLSDLQADIANLNGRLVGYLAAAGVLGGGLVFLAQKVFAK